MSTKFLNRFVLGSSISLAFALSTAIIAQEGLCHHPPGQPEGDHAQDNVVNDTPGHRGHELDHPLATGTCDLGGGVAEVPEPITMLLFGAGLAGVGYAVKRRKVKAE